MWDVHHNDLLNILSIAQVPKAAEAGQDEEDYVDIGVQEGWEEVSIAFHAAVNGHDLKKKREP